MTYLSLKAGDEKKDLNVLLTLAHLKILHNACIDILHHDPDMIGYNAVREELEEIILHHENSLQK